MVVITGVVVVLTGVVVVITGVVVCATGVVVVFIGVVVVVVIRVVVDNGVRPLAEEVDVAVTVDNGARAGDRPKRKLRICSSRGDADAMTTKANMLTRMFLSTARGLVEPVSVQKGAAYRQTRAAL